MPFAFRVNNIVSHVSFTDCPTHCSLCYNSTECYECTQGFYMDDGAECESEWMYLTDKYKCPTGVQYNTWMELLAWIKTLLRRGIHI